MTVFKNFKIIKGTMATAGRVVQRDEGNIELMSMLLNELIWYKIF